MLVEVNQKKSLRHSGVKVFSPTLLMHNEQKCRKSISNVCFLVFSQLSFFTYFSSFTPTAHSIKGIAVGYIQRNPSVSLSYDLLHRFSGVLHCHSKNLDTLVWAEKLMSNGH